MKRPIRNPVIYPRGRIIHLQSSFAMETYIYPSPQKCNIPTSIKRPSPLRNQQINKQTNKNHPRRAFPSPLHNPNHKPPSGRENPTKTAEYPPQCAIQPTESPSPTSHSPTQKGQNCAGRKAIGVCGPEAWSRQALIDTLSRWNNE